MRVRAIALVVVACVSSAVVLEAQEAFPGWTYM